MKEEVGRNLSTLTKKSSYEQLQPAVVKPLAAAEKLPAITPAPIATAVASPRQTGLPAGWLRQPTSIRYPTTVVHSAAADLTAGYALATSSTISHASAVGLAIEHSKPREHARGRKPCWHVRRSNGRLAPSKLQEEKGVASVPEHHYRDA